MAAHVVELHYLHRALGQRRLEFSSSTHRAASDEHRVRDMLAHHHARCHQQPVADDHIDHALAPCCHLADVVAGDFDRHHPTRRAASSSTRSLAGKRL